MQNTQTAAPAIDGCIAACARTLDAIGQFERAGGDYAVIGPHVRHCLDHVVCFLRGLGPGLIEYDARDRDVRVETDADYVRAATRDATDRLAAIAPATLSNAVRVRQVPAPGAAETVVHSTVERELLFLSGHTIHHLAIVTEIAREHGIAITPDLCVAFSTAAYRESCAPPHAL